jgi:hypothetical protein
MLTNCAGPFVFTTLYNSKNNQRILANPSFYFADKETRQKLNDMVVYLHQAGNELTAKDISNDLYEFIRMHYGVITFSALTNWVSKILSNPDLTND